MIFKIKLFSKFGELCGEETPMVRRAVAKNIGVIFCSYK